MTIHVRGVPALLVTAALTGLAGCGQTDSVDVASDGAAGPTAPVNVSPTGSVTPTPTSSGGATATEAPTQRATNTTRPETENGDRGDDNTPRNGQGGGSVETQPPSGSGEATDDSTVVPGVPRCRAAQLDGTLSRKGAATGSVGMDFVLRNTSSESCRMYGYPKLQLVTADGSPLDIRITHDGYTTVPDIRPRKVVVGPGEVASFTFGFPVVPASGQCPEAVAVRIFPPPRPDQALVVEAHLSPCRGRAAVSPVVAGNEGAQPQ